MEGGALGLVVDALGFATALGAAAPRTLVTAFFLVVRRGLVARFFEDLTAARSDV
ncbi:MAG: hypothetical protein KAG66_08765 [Methylococcales bacterium]|nr:hypothetical protein [Methylococcales bacterium]